MTEKKEHPQAKWLRAIADGETPQAFGGPAIGGWHDRDVSDVLSMIAYGAFNARSFRIKPRTIKIGRHEVAEPMRVAPAEGVEYFYLNLGPFESGSALRTSWDGGDDDHDALKSGMCWLNREDAELAAKAFSELLTGVKNDE